MSKKSVIDLAYQEVGYLEKSYAAYKQCPQVLYEKTIGAGKDNYTKYWKDIDNSMQGQAWCQCFIDWLFLKADRGMETLYMKSWNFYTPTCAKYFYDNGAWSTEPNEGDIVYYCSEDKKSSRWKGIYHVELVTAVEGDYIRVVGGNTNNDETRVEPNGGAVADKRIKWKNNPSIAGFGEPRYNVSYRVGWHNDNGNWWYANTEDTWLKDCWKAINGCWYYFGKDGYAYKGLHTIGDERFFFEDRTGHPKECALCRTNDRGALVPWEGIE